MNSISRLCHFHGGLLTAKNSLRLQALALREFKTGVSPLRASMRSRMARIRQQAENRTPFSQTQSISIDAGRAVLLGGAALGLGGLCLYGVYGAGSGSSSLSALDRAAVWPDYVRQRIHSVYAYLGGGAAVAGASAVALVRSPAFIRVMAGGGLLAPLAMLAASIGAGVVCQMIPYPVDGSKFNTKHLAWLVYAASLGGILAPICLVGGPILTRAALYTGGIVGGLSAVAISAPSDRFLTWGGPLAIGLGVVFVSSLGSMFLSPMGRLGAGLYGISLYGGLVLFSGFMLYDTQMVIRRAEQHPPPNRMIYGSPGLATRPFDPINNSIKILLDTVNIFVRMVAIFAGGNSRRK
uniref:Growth hormone-inducible transmembrane protein n=1 Tax=Mesocestoides corti TaxID=53468 RepID=A0A5K3FK04_MESCO